MAAQRIGPGRGDLLDVHPAFRREQDQWAAARGVDQHRGVELAGDPGLLLQQDRADRVAVDPHAEDALGDAVCVFRGVSRLDAAALPRLPVGT